MNASVKERHFLIEFRLSSSSDESDHEDQENVSEIFYTTSFNAELFLPCNLMNTKRIDDRLCIT